MRDSGETMLHLEPAEIEFPCPRCDFYNPITFGEARLGTPIICRGCKNTIRPDDPIGELEDAKRRIEDSIRELKRTIEGLGR
jgi:hypothetical protein